MDTVRVGVIGTGAMGSGHLGNYMDIPGYKVTAVCDIDDKALDKAKTKSGAPGFSDYRELLDQKDVDMVSVVTSNVSHAPIATAALEAGKHVFLEKPIAMNVDEAKAIREARDTSGKKVQVGVCVRFWGGPQMLKAHIDAGELGNIYFAKCGYLRRHGIPGMGSWFTTKSQSGGGPVVDLGVHALDLTMWLMGNFKPVSAMACSYAEFGPKGLGGSDWGTTMEKGVFDVEDLAAGIVRFENGASLFLEVSWAAHVGGGKFYSTLMGSDAGADLDPLTIYSDEFGKHVDKKLTAPEVNGYEAEHKHFVDAIINDTDPMPNLDEAIAVQAVLDAIRKSAETGVSEKVLL